MKKIVPALLASLALTVMVHAEVVSHEFAVPGHGALVLMTPANWVAHVQAGEKGGPPTIELSDPDGSVKLVITPLWSPTGDASFNSTDAIRESISRAAQKAQETSVEKELPLKEFYGKSGRGYYFWATDRAPKPDGYEYMAQGAFPVGNLMVGYTVLSHVAPPKGMVGVMVASTSRQISTNL
jgi:hypothetical protein